LRVEFENLIRHTRKSKAFLHSAGHTDSKCQNFAAFPPRTARRSSAVNRFK
jgi:hypothetical protein